MRNYTLIFWLMTMIMVSSFPLIGQTSDSPYHLSLKRELVYTGSGLLSLGLGTYLQSRASTPLLSELKVQNFSDINAFDRLANTLPQERAAKLSDLGLYGGAALTLGLLAGERTRQDFPTISVLFVEMILITGGVTNSLKAGFLRPRPYVYGEEWDPQQPLETGDRAAFVSGHTSIAAAGSFFFARVFSDYYPDSKLKPYIWGVAIIVPTVTGYWRIKAAKHFPTDIIGGYLLGASIGYFVPVLHKKSFLPKGMSMGPTGQGVYLSYQF